MRLSLSALRRCVAAVLALGAVGLASCDTPPTPPPDPGTARLVICPNPNPDRSTSSLIGIAGGLLSLDGTVVGIPSGALSLPTLITLTIPTSQYMEVDVTAGTLGSFLFNKEIAVQIDYSRCTDPALATAKLSVWHIDSETGQLKEFMGGVDDKAKRTITFKTNHLSAYAIAF